jgi:hypothetical protein
MRVQLWLLLSRRLRLLGGQLRLLDGLLDGRLDRILWLLLGRMLRLLDG